MNKIRILLAEDNPGDVLLVRQALEEYSVPHELEVARDGDEALAWITRMGDEGAKRCPDLMLLDLNLPKVDGHEVLARFREHPACTETPVIVVTSSDTPKDRARLAGLGVSHYFKKPSDLTEFLKLGAVVKEVISGSQAAM